MQVGWGHVAALGLVGWLGWRLGQRMAAQAAERAQQALVESQLQQQALAEALAEQRAVSGRGSVWESGGWRTKGQMWAHPLLACC